MDYHAPKYPYRLYIAGTLTFNNYFLFSYYMNEYKTDKTFLYAPKFSMLDTMTRLYATANNLCYLSCNVDKCLQHYHNATALNFKIADMTDMLIAFWDGQTQGLRDLEYAFKAQKKKTIIIDITKEDMITPYLEPSLPYKDKKDFYEVFGPFIDPLFITNSCPEKAMKFIADAYTHKDLMQCIIDNRYTDLVVTDKLSEAIKSLLTWIYTYQFDTLLSDFKTMTEPELPPQLKRFSKDEYKHATPCEWMEEGEKVEIYTGTGLPLAHGYTGLVEIGNHSYIEINSVDLIKSHIHKSLKARAFTEEEDECIKVTYHTSDTESYPITYQVANFETSRFRMGYWYISTDFVTKVPPTPKEKPTLEE